MRVLWEFNITRRNRCYILISKTIIMMKRSNKKLRALEEEILTTGFRLKRFPMEMILFVIQIQFYCSIFLQKNMSEVDWKLKLFFQINNNKFGLLNVIINFKKENSIMKKFRGYRHKINSSKYPQHMNKHQ